MQLLLEKGVRIGPLFLEFMYARMRTQIVSERNRYRSHIIFCPAKHHARSLTLSWVRDKMSSMYACSHPPPSRARTTRQTDTEKCVQTFLVGGTSSDGPA